MKKKKEKTVRALHELNRKKDSQVPAIDYSPLAVRIVYVYENYFRLHNGATQIFMHIRGRVHVDDEHMGMDNMYDWWNLIHFEQNNNKPIKIT